MSAPVEGLRLRFGFSLRPPESGARSLGEKVLETSERQWRTASTVWPLRLVLQGQPPFGNFGVPIASAQRG